MDQEKSTKSATIQSMINKITVCSSVSFYKDCLELEEELIKMGFKVLLPVTAYVMKKTGNYDVSSYKTWFKDKGDYGKKAELIRQHFAKIAEGDVILVVNNKKHGVAGYIGANVLMEMGLAFHLNKPIFILNEIAGDNQFKEEIFGMNPVFLNGDLKTL